MFEGMKWIAKKFSPERQLAKTCALEHFTAMLAELMLEEPEFLEGMDQRMLPLWLWHAVEESEHKAVAFDVYADQVDNYWIRTSEMALPWWNSSASPFSIISSCARGWTISAICVGGQWLELAAGPPRPAGLATVLSAYYKPSFHPEKKDSVLRERALAQLADTLDRPELAPRR